MSPADVSSRTDMAQAFKFTQWPCLRLLVAPVAGFYGATAGEVKQQIRPLVTRTELCRFDVRTGSFLRDSDVHLSRPDFGPAKRARHAKARTARSSASALSRLGSG